MFLGNAHIHKLLAGFLTPFGCPVPYAGSSRRDGTEGVVLFHPLEQMCGRQFVIGLCCKRMFQFTRIYIERCAPVPAFLVLLCPFVSFTLQSVDMYHHRMICVLHLPEGIYKRTYIVSLIHIYIVKSHGTEKVVAAGSARLPELLQVVIQSAMVLCYRHLVVIDYDDEVCTQLGGPVESFKCLASAERPVADDGNHIASLASQVTPLGQSAGKADRSGGVPDNKMVVLTLRGFAVARHIIVVVFIQKRAHSSRQHLVWITLMGHVEHDFILRRTEHVMHGNGNFHHAQVRTAVSAMSAQLLHKQSAHLPCHLFHFLHGQSLDVGRRFNVLYHHLFLYLRTFWVPVAKLQRNTSADHYL